MTQPPPSRAPSPLLLAISSLFVATLVASNILAVKIADVGPFSVPAAIVIFLNLIEPYFDPVHRVLVALLALVVSSPHLLARPHVLALPIMVVCVLPK